MIDQDATTLANLLVFSRNVGTGALTPVTGTTIGATQSTGYLSGVTASSVVVAPRGVFVYVSDSASNQIIGYTVGNGGALTAMTNGPFPTGSLPVNMTIDPRGSFLYAVDQNDAALSAFTINSSSGALGAVSGTAKPLVQGNTPTCVTIENALGVYLYVSNFVSGTVSGFQLNATTGALSQIRNSPYPGVAAPSCVAAIANATHASAVQSIQ